TTIRSATTFRATSVVAPRIRRSSRPSKSPRAKERRLDPDTRRATGRNDMIDAIATATGPWYKTLDRRQWYTLLAANLGWLFDGFELYALFLTVGPAMRALRDPSQSPQLPAYIGMVVAITLLGWGIGGMIGGILADYIGRKRTMIFAILAYSITT